MVVPRTAARWAINWAHQAASPARHTACSRVTQRLNRRGYASQGSHHGAHKSGSDFWWIVGSLTVTIPSVAYLIQPQFKKGTEDAHGHGHHSPDGKGGHVDDTEPGDLVPNLRKSESDDGDDQKDEDTEGKAEESSDESGSQSEEEQSDGTPDTSEDEEPQDTAHETDSGENVEGVQFKGATSGGTREGEQGDTRKHIPDAKGGSKKRIESDYGRPQGVAGDDNLEKDESGKTMDKPAAAKTAGDMSTQSGKQEGLSNTDTKHSTDIANDPDKSKKGEGTPETSKSKGTVDPTRPPAENRAGPEQNEG